MEYTHKIATLIPIWKRPDVTQVVVEHIMWLNWQLEDFGIQLWPFVVRSPEDPEPFDWTALADEDWTILTCKNEPLGRKWNYGVAAAYIKHKQFNSFTILGSDNLVSRRYIIKAVQALRDGADLVGIGQCIFYDMLTGEAGQVSPGVQFGYGPARLYSLEVMRQLQWRLVDHGQNKKMESILDQRLIQLQNRHGWSNVVLPLTYSSHESDHVTLVDLKGRTNMNSFAAARKARKKKGHWIDLHGDTVPGLYSHLKCF